MSVDPLAFLESVSFAYVFLMGFVSFTVALVVGMVFRAYVDERVPWPVPLIAGVGVIGLWTNTASVLVQFVESTEAVEPLIFQNIETNAAALLVGGVAAFVGAGVGDRAAPNLRALTGAQHLDTEVNRIVRTVGRFTTVTVPGARKIEDIEGFEPLDQETKEQFAGVELVFPRGLTVDQLRKRITTRLREDYGVGNVDIELTDDGTIDYLAVGSRAAGIGPTLPPRKIAIAVEADPPDAASPGDRVHLWRDEGGARRVATGELWATSDDVATLIVDASRASAIDQSAEYHLVTLHTRKQSEKEFAALLRAANETMESITVGEGVLDGLPVGALRPVVAAVRAADGSLETLPPRFRKLAPGETLYTIGRPDELRKLEAHATPPRSDAGSVSEPTGIGDESSSRGLSGRIRRLVGRV